MKRLKIVSLLILLLLALSARSQNTHIIEVYDFRFEPNQLSIIVGDTVRFVWKEGNHTTTSISIPSGSIPWNEAMNSSNSTFDYVPVSTGNYGYFCQIHGTSMNMTGQFGVWDLNSIRETENFALNILNANGSLVVSSPFATSLRYTIFALNGSLVLQGDLAPDNNSIASFDELPAGLYLFTAILPDGTMVSRKIIR